jgi:hypothetical protein
LLFDFNSIGGREIVAVIFGFFRPGSYQGSGFSPAVKKK